MNHEVDDVARQQAMIKSRLADLSCSRRAIREAIPLTHAVGLRDERRGIGVGFRSASAAGDTVRTAPLIKQTLPLRLP